MNTQTFFLSLAILGSSFWGSWHCAAMCGPIASLAARRNALWSYHLGKGISYTILGALGGALGSFFLSNDFQKLRWINAIIFASILIFLGLQNLRGKRNFYSLKLHLLHRLFTPHTPAFVLGLLSLFLPCGWLYSYLLAAVATRSAQAGALLMILFWLGSLPSLSAVSVFMKKSIEIAPRKKQIVAGLLLTTAGLYSLFSFYLVNDLFH